MKIKGILLDIDGVLYVGDKVIEGAIETINILRKKYIIRFITNTTTKTKDQLYQKLVSMGFQIKKNEIFSALDAVKSFLEKEKAGAFFLVKEEVKGEFKKFEELPVKYVVVADARENFTYKNMNTAFRLLIEGASLIAAAKNRYFKDSDGKLSLDAGAFVTGLEYSSGKQAKILGKPDKEFFLSAVKSMKLLPEQVAVVGDDIESDVEGGMNAGLYGILVKTGKFREEDLKKGIKPDLIIDSIKDLPTALENINKT